MWVILGCMSLVLFLIFSIFTEAAVFACCLTVVCVGTFLYFKNPPPNKVHAQEVLQPHKCSVIGHRAAGHDAPENTLEAIYEAKENGADGIEFDIDFTSDGVPVVIHDDTVDRTTNGYGNVREMTFEKIRSLNAAAKHDKRDQFPVAKVPTLEEVIELCLELGLKMYIDVKNSDQMAVTTLVDMYKKYPALYNNAVVCSFFPKLVYMTRRSDPEIVTALIFRKYHHTHDMKGIAYNLSRLEMIMYSVIDLFLGWCIYSWLWEYCATSAFLMNLTDVSVHTVQCFNSHGIQVVVWTPNFNYDKDYVCKTLGCSYITDTLKGNAMGQQEPEY